MIWFQNPLKTNFQSSNIIKLIPRAPPPGKKIVEPLEGFYSHPQGSLLVVESMFLWRATISLDIYIYIYMRVFLMFAAATMMVGKRNTVMYSHGSIWLSLHVEIISTYCANLSLVVLVFTLCNDTLSLKQEPTIDKLWSVSNMQTEITAAREEKVSL